MLDRIRQFEGADQVGLFDIREVPAWKRIASRILGRATSPTVDGRGTEASLRQPAGLDHAGSTH